MLSYLFYIIDWLPQPIFQPLSASKSSVQRASRHVNMRKTPRKHVNLLWFCICPKGWILELNTSHLTSELLTTLLYECYEDNVQSLCVRVSEASSRTSLATEMSPESLVDNQVSGRCQLPQVDERHYNIPYYLYVRTLRVINERQICTYLPLRSWYHPVAQAEIEG